MLVGYFCTYISRLLDFDIDDMISFGTKYFFHPNGLFYNLLEVKLLLKFKINELNIIMLSIFK